ncbi:YibE/F family protein [Nocardioidaceae bacterium SCSIO 66511]|nr:YibE/F family protein [Nocardioidaceae bacterium SCSIO 66511]
MTAAGGRRRREPADHGHTHDLSDPALAGTGPRPLVSTALTAIVVVVGLCAAVAMVVLWPHGDGKKVPEGYAGEKIKTTITAVQQCQQGPECLEATAEIDGKEQPVLLPVGPGAPEFSVGDDILVNDGGKSAATGSAAPQYSFMDFDRTTPLIWLAALFVIAVLALSRWKGLLSLVSLGASLVVVSVFVVPALIDGKNPLLIALTASALIMILAVYATQGVNVRSSVALVGTLASLALAGAIGAVFTALGNFTGFGDESMKFLVAIIGEVDVRGLLLAGLIIGALGVLDDVTVTQTAAVWEISAADPTASRREVFAAAMRIGRAHVSATVNTLVLAYVGASLPLLMLMSAIDASVRDQLLSEGVAQEVVRGLAGSLGIVAAVPITTALATLVVTRREPSDDREVQPG